MKAAGSWEGWFSRGFLLPLQVLVSMIHTTMKSVTSIFVGDEGLVYASLHASLHA